MDYDNMRKQIDDLYASTFAHRTCAGCSKRLPRQHVQAIGAEFARTVARLAERQERAA